MSMNNDVYASRLCEIKKGLLECDEKLEELKSDKSVAENEIESIKNNKLYKKAIFTEKGAKRYFLFIYLLLLAVLFIDFFLQGEISAYVFEFVKFDLSKPFGATFKVFLYGLLLYIIWRIFGLNYLFHRAARKKAVVMKETLKDLENKIDIYDTCIDVWNEKRKPFEFRLEKLEQHIKNGNDKTVQEFVQKLENSLYGKKYGGKSATMYEPLYPWVDHLYDVGYKDAEKYEAILLLCEEDIYLTPKERKEYCAKRLQEINGYRYYRDYKIYEDAWKGVGLSMFSQNTSSSSDLTDADAWHATQTMMGGNSIDTTGM